MKRCPECGRDYNDDSLSYCLDDGSELLFGPGSNDGPATAILHDTSSPSEAATRAQILTPEKAATNPDVRKQSTGRRMLLVSVVVVILTVGGFFAYRYFKTDNSGTINSVAVLPFENRSSEPETDYLSDGLAESLIFRLSQLPGLKVSPTSSVMKYKGKGGNLASIARELGVRAVMTGRVVQRGQSLTVSIELIDVPNNQLLWGEQYEREMGELLATQREIATTITQKLRLKLSGDEAGIAKKFTTSNEAYQLYLKGRHHFARRTRDEVFKALEAYDQAVKLDPTFALAYARIGEVYNQMPAYAYRRSDDAYPQAKAAALRALELDPDLAEAHVALGNTLAAYEWNWAEADRKFKTALELDPNSASVHFRYGGYLAMIGRYDEAVENVMRGIEIEPLDVNMTASAAWWNIMAGNTERALELGRRAYDLDPNNPAARNVLAQIYLTSGMYAEGLALVERSATFSPHFQWWEFQNVGVAYAKLGRRTDALNAIAEMKTRAKTEYVMSYPIATIYSALGDKDNAFDQLEDSLRLREWRLLFINGDPFMKPLRDDPRFKSILRRMNLPE